MSRTQEEKQAVAQRGEEIYETQIRAKVEENFDGKIVAIDVNSGDYEIDAETMTAGDKLRLRKPDAMVYFMRIGSPDVYTFSTPFLPRIKL